MNPNYLIFTDLDGTLLDHHIYSFSEAMPMLYTLKQRKIPVIIATSKTRSEVEILQNQLGIHDPFIVENGAGIFMPKDDGFEMIALGYTYNQTREYFDKYAKKINMRGFLDMSIQDIADLTGLSIENAAVAKKRDFSEPFVLEDESQLSKLKKMASKDGFDIVKGGRFYHLITIDQDKATAVKKVIEIYSNIIDKEFKTVALGDGQNDLTMLECVDIPILIPHPDGTYTNFDVSGLIKAEFPGPKGWRESLKGCLDAE